jgi:hypothetical protein
MATTFIRVFLFVPDQFSLVVVPVVDCVIHLISHSFLDNLATELTPSYQKQTSQEIADGAIIQSQFTCTAAKTTPQAPAIHCYLPTTYMRAI